MSGDRPGDDPEAGGQLEQGQQAIVVRRIRLDDGRLIPVGHVTRMSAADIIDGTPVVSVEYRGTRHWVAASSVAPWRGPARRGTRSDGLLDTSASPRTDPAGRGRRRGAWIRRHRWITVLVVVLAVAAAITADEIAHLGDHGGSGGAWYDTSQPWGAVYGSALDAGYIDSGLYRGPACNATGQYDGGWAVYSCSWSLPDGTGLSGIPTCWDVQPPNARPNDLGC